MHSCETQFTTVINDWVKILDSKWFEKAFDTPLLMNSLKTSCLAMVLVERH